MGTYNREYKGVAYTIDTYESRGRWRWSCTLGDEFFETKDRAIPSEAIAINEADADARCRIDNGAGN